MKHTREEILDALKVIKETCDDFDCCNACPFYKFTESLNWNASCAIRDQNETPADWELRENHDVWRAFL